MTETIGSAMNNSIAIADGARNIQKVRCGIGGVSTTSRGISVTRRTLSVNET